MKRRWFRTETGDYADNAPIAVAKRKSSVSQANTWNINSPLPWVAICLIVSGYAIHKADVAHDRAILAEREARIIEDDTKYVRAYLSARGINIPANHEEAEDR